MEIQNLRYGIEPEHILYTTGIIVIFFIFLLHWLIKFTRLKKSSVQLSVNERLKISFFCPMTAIYFVLILACIALFQNVIHDYEIEHKYLSINNRQIFFTVETYPDGERQAQDDFSSTLFVQQMKAKYNKKKQDCNIEFVFVRYSNNLPFSDKSEENCFKTAKELQNIINISRKNDFPKLKTLESIDLETTTN